MGTNHSKSNDPATRKAKSTPAGRRAKYASLQNTALVIELYNTNAVPNTKANDGKYTTRTQWSEQQQQQQQQPQQQHPPPTNNNRHNPGVMLKKSQLFPALKLTNTVMLKTIQNFMESAPA